MIMEKIRRLAVDGQVPVLGIGPASAMADEPPGYRPDDFLPDAQSLLCFGIPVPRDAYATSRYSLEIAWRSQNLLYRRLDTLALRFCSLLEEGGDRSVPIYGCMPLGVDQKGTVVGLVNQIRMAETTRIGVIGKNGLLIHSRYGSRLMLGGLITTASLPVMHYPDNGEPGCPSTCQICSDACPVNAIMPDKKQVNIMRCLNYTARTPAMSKLNFFFLRIRNKIEAARYMSMTAFDEHTFHICSKCVSLCPYGGNNETARCQPF